MVQIASFAVVVAVLAGQTLAIKNCVVGRVYCGGTLLREPDFQQWKTAIDNALIRAGQPVDGTHESDSTFTCNPDTVNVTWSDWCIDNPGNIRCQPNNSGKCTGFNDCCAVA